MSQDCPIVFIVGFPDSVHTVRWIRMLLGTGIKVVLIPVYKCPVAGDTVKVRTVATADDLAGCSDTELAFFDFDSVTEDEISEIRQKTGYQPWRPWWLSQATMAEAAHLIVAVQRLRPRLVHTMVVQFGGYLALAAREYMGEEFPGWLLSNWGSDIYLYRMIPEHRERLRNIALLIDGYHAECVRDYAIIRQMGFRQFAFPAIPATGGEDFSAFPALNEFPRPSERRDIVIKGYHGWAGRSLHLLSAVHLAADTLRPFTIRITLASPEVRAVAETMAKADGLNIVVEPYVPDHMDALRRLGNARIVAGMGISDGISTTLLESMAVGAFPILGTTSCGNEWIASGKSGMLLSPHDVAGLADAFRRAATDDSLVDTAAVVNRRVVEKRWNSAINRDVVL